MYKSIRVLHVFGRLNRGGAETLVMNLYRNIDRTKIQFDFIVHTNEKCAFDDEIRSLGGKIYRVPRYNGKNHFQYKKSWNELFQEHPEYKIIHGHVRSTASIYLKIAKSHGLKTISHSHSTSSGRGLSAIVKNVLQYPIRYIADYLFACSKSAGEWLFGKKACQGDNFFILNNAIDTKKFIFNKEIRDKKRKELRIENNFVIGHIGRFISAKNHDFLVDILKKVHDENKNTVLLLVGDGELRQSIEEKVKNLGLSDSVIFAGVRSDVPELLQAMDVFVFPSLYEGLPVTLVEVQAAGIPCIVSDRITKEVFITSCIQSISLKKDVKEWVDRIFTIRQNLKRKETLNYIIEAGFDIRETSEKLTAFYFNLY